jgi:hypothetical protein
LEEVKNDLLKIYDQRKTSNPTKRGDSDLAACGKKYKGRCNSCGKLDHKDADFWTLEK